LTRKKLKKTLKIALKKSKTSLGTAWFTMKKKLKITGNNLLKKKIACHGKYFQKFPKTYLAPEK
jgi:hypothetical protein